MRHGFNKYSDIDENTCVGTHTDGVMDIYLLFISTIKDNRVIMIITIK